MVVRNISKYDLFIFELGKKVPADGKQYVLPYKIALRYRKYLEPIKMSESGKRVSVPDEYKANKDKNIVKKEKKSEIVDKENKSEIVDKENKSEIVDKENKSEIVNENNASGDEDLIENFFSDEDKKSIPKKQQIIYLLKHGSFSDEEIVDYVKTSKGYLTKIKNSIKE